jgi:hypothetical protein
MPKRLQGEAETRRRGGVIEGGAERSEIHAAKMTRTGSVVNREVRALAGLLSAASLPKPR